VKLYQNKNYRKMKICGLDDEVLITVHDPGVGLYLHGDEHKKTFKVCKSVHHHTLQINQPSRCNNFSILLLDVYLQLNMFRVPSRPSSGAQQLQ